MKGEPRIEIENIEYDSRLSKRNGLFFAIKGYQQDGYDFVPQAVKNGAVAVMGERETCETANYVRVSNIRAAMAEVSARFYGYPGLALKACGVTGTNGKTTTCFLIKQILEQRDKTTGLICSLVYDTGKETFKADRTTPEALDVQRLLFLMKKNRCVNVVIEVSSHALMLNRVDQVNFRVAVYTNITRDHLDFHGTMEEYFNAKARLAARLEGELSYAVINLDVPEFRKLFGGFDASYLTYSVTDPVADVYAGGHEIMPDKTIFNLVTPMGTRTVQLNLPGKFNLSNALAAAAGGLACGADLDAVVAGLERAKPIPGRFNHIDCGQPFAVYIDFAHTPDALERLIQSARDIIKGKIYLMFGCGGDRDRGKRPLMGKAATEGADFVVVTSDNPRSENPMDIIEEIKPGLVGEAYEIIPDRAQAIERIINKAEVGDGVLLAGKGAEFYQEVKGVKHRFSDVEMAQSVMARLGYVRSSVREEH